MTLEQWTEILGWCSIINVGLLLLATVMLVALRTPIMHLHRRLLGLTLEDLPAHYFRYLANYKLLVLVFNLVPYVAMKIIA